MLLLIFGGGAQAPVYMEAAVTGPDSTAAVSSPSNTGTVIGPDSTATLED